jgi:hypothetical protein
MAAPPGEDAARSPTCWPTRVGGVRPRVEPDGEGGRLAFGPEGCLYICTGDADQRDPAQDKRSLNGKILRVTKDGAPTVPSTWLKPTSTELEQGGLPDGS